MDDPNFSITHHGAVNGVTGSCHQLTLDSGPALLVDCGLFQGAEAEDNGRQSPRVDFPLGGVEALLVTHCHIDHVGRIPYLLAAGFDKPIYATEATAQLLPLVIEDAVKVGISRDSQLIEGVLQRLRQLLRQLLRPMPYRQWFDIEGMPGARAKFKMAGHILGSAYIELDIEQAQGASHRVLFSGDLGAPYAPLLPAPQPAYRADTLVLESTYGDRRHSGRRERRRQLQRILEHCLANNGTVLIPAFSIGRTQELLYEIESIIHSGGQPINSPSLREEAQVNSLSPREEPQINSLSPPRERAGVRAASTIDWPNLDIIVDSPLAADFTRHYQQLSHLWDKEARQRKCNGRHPLAFEQLITIDDHSQHQKLVNLLRQSARPAVVIAASGMCSGGRIVNYLKTLLPEPSTDVLFVGYQAQGTPGHDIQQWGPQGGYVWLDGEKVTINAGIHTLSGYSAHADQQDLLRFVTRMRYTPRQIRLVHGDLDAKQTLARELRQRLPGCEIIVP